MNKGKRWYEYNFTDGSTKRAFDYVDNKYKKQTHNGFAVKNIFKSRRGYNYAVVERQKGTFTSPDYFVGAIYDTKSGYWQQGYYDFSTRQKAINFAKRKAYKK